MISGLTKLAQPLLLMLPPEQAHEATLVALEKGLYPRSSIPSDPRIAVSTLGLTFPNPIGMAPGFDKEGRVPDALLDIALDSGFHAVFARIEAGGTASRRLHEKCGFQLVGIERQVGRKFGRWLDVALMECLLHERERERSPGPGPTGRP